jgi:hypothetical protein
MHVVEEEVHAGQRDWQTGNLQRLRNTWNVLQLKRYQYKWRHSTKNQTSDTRLKAIKILAAYT